MIALISPLATRRTRLRFSPTFSFDLCAVTRPVPNEGMGGPARQGTRMGTNASRELASLNGHALRNARLRLRALERARTAPPLAGAIVHIRAHVLGMTRLEFSRRSGISRGTLRDLELGIHTPTRRIMKRVVSFCRNRNVDGNLLEQVQDLYAGSGSTLEQLIARLELAAGSPRELARRVGISATTLWEYRRGNFPLPLALLRRLYGAVGEDPTAAEKLWYQVERERLAGRGYPPALAEFWTLCARAGHCESQLLTLGLSTATVRRLRYLEIPNWDEVAKVAKTLCCNRQEFLALQAIWKRDREQRERGTRAGFGARVQKLRKQQGIGRRELADLFEIGGKKPARIIKYIEEEASIQPAYPRALLLYLRESDASGC